MVLPNTRFRTARKWSAFTPQRMVKGGSGVEDMNSGTPPQSVVTGFASDSNHPAVVTSGTTLVVAGGGTVTVTANIMWETVRSDDTVRFDIMRNGASVSNATTTAGSTTGSLTVSWTGSLANGDQIQLYGTASRSGGLHGPLPGTYIDVRV